MANAPAIASRRLVPELLDFLPPDDRRAIGARRDLVWVNAFMLQVPIMRGLLTRHCNGTPRRLVDVGAGDGRFMLAVARRLASRWPGVELTLLDRTACVEPATLDAFARLGWQARALRADIFEWSKAAPAGSFDIVTANLFLHHFEDERLAELFSLIRPLAPLFIATEPLRSSLALLGARLLPLIGVNAITRHDAVVSVRAGFRGRELSALWQGRVLEERSAGLYTHAFAAAES